MNKHKMNNQGFSAFEAILILLIVSIVGFIGWYVWHGGDTQTAITKTPLPTPATGTTDVTKKITPPEGWVKYASGNVSFYLPGDWKVEPNNLSLTADITSYLRFTDKTNTFVFGFMAMKMSKGYSMVLADAKADKLIDGIAETIANGYKVISYMAYGTADKDPKNRSSVNIIFIGNEEYRLIGNPNNLGASDIPNILKTVQKN